MPPTDVQVFSDFFFSTFVFHAGHSSDSALALANFSVMVVSRMAISEQKKVALCDGAARLPLNLFVFTHPPIPHLFSATYQSAGKRSVNCFI